MKPKMVIPVVLGHDGSRPDFRGLEHESLEEAIKRGKKITICESHYVEERVRWAFPNDPKIERGQTLNDGRG